MGQVFMAPREGSSKISLEGFNHLTWRYKIIPYIRTDNCTDMSNMFSGANYSLPEILDLRAFNTSNVTTMRSMFDNCVSEEILGLDNFNTTNVTDMAFMFNASKATELDLSNFNTSHVTDMENMFCNCDVEDLDISNFDTSLVTNMSCMFENVEAPINTSNFDTSEVTTMHNMFKGTSGTTLDLSNFDTSSVTDMSGMFQSSSYEEIDMSSFDTSSVTNMKSMFDGCTVDEVDMSTFNVFNVTDMSLMFRNCTLNSLIFPNNFDTSNVLNINSLFNGLTIPTLDLRGIDFPSIETRSQLFANMNANILDLSDWDLGSGASTTAESLFHNSTIDELRLSNSNNFPEGYNIGNMFGYFTTDGTLDLSNFNFDKAVNEQGNPMFRNAHINTLIMGNITSNEFANNIRESVNGNSFFRQTSVELLDMSSSLIEISGGNNFFDGIVATRINMPNQICIEIGEYDLLYSSHGRAKYVDYSSVDTRNADYTVKQWEHMSKYTTQYNKIVWIPSTFILDGNHTMYFSSGDIYTNALSYTDLGWSSEPDGVTMHYGSTHADFEQAILNDDPDEWVSPLGYPLFYCYKSVPLDTTMKRCHFEAANYQVYYDDLLIADPDNYIFTELGTHTLKITVDGYEYKQKITVVDHGSSYTVVGNPRDYSWNGSSYSSTASTKVQCRLYPDKYLFIYSMEAITHGTGYYTAIESAPNTTITKVSGAPFFINQVCLNGCTQLTDISELIIMSNDNYRGFNPSNMFNNCTSLADVSIINKWKFTSRYSYYNRSSSYTRTVYDDYNYSSMFYRTRITTAPSISISAGSSGVFYQCYYLTDISKLNKFSEAGSYSSSDGYTFSNIFYDCSRLTNVSRLKYVLSSMNGYNLNLNGFLYGTAITNTDFIPDNGISVRTIQNMFNNCTSLSNLSGLSRLRFVIPANFDGAFNNIPATDYSPLSNWSYKFTGIYFAQTKISNLSFIANWDLSKCTYLYLYNNPNLTSISVLSGKLDTTTEITVNLGYCSALTSLTGLENCILSSQTSFEYCSSLINLNGLIGCTIKKCNSLFSNCSSLTSIYALSQVTFSEITNANSMFNNCRSLTSLNGLQTLDVSNCTSLASTFFGCASLSDISAISGWNPYQVKNVGSLFRGCSSITSFAPLHNWTTSQLTNMDRAFSECSSLVNLDGLVGFNPGQCTSLQYLFYNCTALTDISDITYWYVGRCTNMTYMFSGCTSLLSVDPLKNWNIASLTNMTRMFSGDVSVADAEVLNNWSNIKNMSNVTRSYAFYQVPTPWPTWA